MLILILTYIFINQLKGNPLADHTPSMYRAVLVDKIKGLKHLDLKRINDDERVEARHLVQQPRPMQYILASEVSTVDAISKGTLRNIM
jgi:hypothetical protein